MLAQLGDKVSSQRPLVAVTGVCQHMLGAAHADNGRAHRWIGKHEAQRDLGQAYALGQHFLKALDPLDGRNQVLWAEVARPPVRFRETGVEGHLSAQTTFVERDTGDDAYVHFTTQGKEFVLGRLIKDVVDHLDSVDQAGTNRLDPVLWLP